MNDFARPLFWNVPHWAEWTLYALTALTVGLFLVGMWWRVRKWLVGQAEPGGVAIVPALRQRIKELGNFKRLKELAFSVLFQWRLSKDSFATMMHLAIFWGMVVLFLGTAIATVDQDFTNLPFDYQFLTGNVYRLFELSLDVFGVMLVVGLGMAAFRRYLARPARLKANVAGVSKFDAFPFLLILLLIAVTGFVAEGLRIAEGMQLDRELQMAIAPEFKREAIEAFGIEERLHLIGEDRRAAELFRLETEEQTFPAAAWAPVGYALGKAFSAMSLEGIRVAHQLTWWAHGLLAFAFIVCIPFTKAFHLISSPINMLFRPAEPVGKLAVVADSGVERIEQFTWRQLLQLDACTWCGKCQEVCPANETGFALSPRDVVQKLDRALLAAVRNGGSTNGNGHSIHGGDGVSADELWACVTCRACEEVCPVQVEQPRLIADLRRRLVDQGEIDEGLQDALMNFQRDGNSFGQSARKRAAWAKKFEPKVKDARKEEVDYLWFVGDYASYDPRLQGPTQAIARALQHLQVDFGILYDKEQNAGNDVRRVGEEGLFEMLQENNCKVLDKATFAKVLTTDPHTYNTLKNEYGPDTPVAGRPVIHYTELFDQLIADGKLKVKQPQNVIATYHDPCYLGRYNGIYDAPRNVLEALGVRLVEMPRCRENSFCCGAGGGRVWMKDTPGIDERPAEVRVREALELPGVECLVVACPKDLAMFQDAVKTVGAEDRLRVVDLGELVYESLGIVAEAEESVEEKAEA